MAKESRSYHGNFASYQKKDGKEICYFNPFFNVEDLKITDFRYIFKDLALAEFEKNNGVKNKKQLISNLTKLGESMVDQFDDATNIDVKELNSKIPAGYTYFGQFIDHDITAGSNAGNEFQITSDNFGPLNPDRVERDMRNQRTPQFDLDSVYGGPGNAYLTFPHFYQEDDPILLKIGTNEQSIGVLPDSQLDVNPSNPQRDLPRIGSLRDNVRSQIPGLADRPATAALIGDMRNDENLVIAQFHLAFLKGHNQLVKDIRKMSPRLSNKDVFNAARRELTLIYQWLVVNDFLKQILDEEVMELLLSSKDGIFELKPEVANGEIYMPLEFSTAAYRFGHTMVRNQYDFNLNFGRPEGNGPLLDRSNFNLLFAFTGTGAKRDGSFNETLPFNWIIQWNRFFETENHIDALGVPISDRFTRSLDTKLADFITGPTKGMQNEEFGLLPDIKKEEALNTAGSIEMFNSIMKRLAIRNLLRGYLLNMPSGQKMVLAINGLNRRKLQLEILSEEDILDNAPTDLKKFLVKSNFHRDTPLWYYILKEAEIQNTGNALGHLGSWLVGQTIIGLIKNGEGTSIIRENWTPKKSIIPELKNTKNIMDLLIYAGVATNRANNPWVRQA